MVPGYKQEWHLGVRSSKNQKLLAFISGIPIKAQIKRQTVKMAEINYLCVNKKLRSKRLAPVLIKEITRRVNLKGVWQAIYTAGIVIPRPVSSATYYHRSLNPKKLVDIGFSALPLGETMANHVKKNKLPKENEIQINGYIREMTKKDISGVFNLLRAKLETFAIHQKLNQEELGHLVLPREGVIHSYVVENIDTKEITDFVSFYKLPTQILNQGPHGYTSLEVRNTQTHF
jgi:glycylpeptide N-tetradecanoyltransferase